MDAEPAMDGPPTSVDARPYPYTFDPATTALLIIDMQRDFLEPEGFGETLGNDVSLLAPVIPAVKSLLDAARSIGMTVIHTREGHRPDLTDLHEAKRVRGNPTLEIGDPGPKGRILVRGEYGHDIIDELAPIAGEAVLDKPGKGAFYATDLGLMLAKGGITSLIVTGVTTEVCVHTTVREANDRGFECLVVEDGTGSYFPEFHAMALKMISAQGGIFGWTATSAEILSGLGLPTTTGDAFAPEATTATTDADASTPPTPITTGA
ncbi:MAG: isochorismatase family cysteine hydrolase [Patulibacter sp.]|nr:isochorismatase family cysteine hydrolase [Patulibacter sp.]